MANYKDNNADIGNQTIEGTVSPYDLDTVLAMPYGAANGDSSTYEAAALDERLAELIGDTPAATPDPDEQLAAFINDTPADTSAMDAELEALMAEPVTPVDNELDSKLDELLKEDTDAEQSEPIILAATDEPVIVAPADEPVILAATDDTVIVPPADEPIIPDQPEEPITPPADEPIILAADEPIVPDRVAEEQAVPPPADEPADQPVVTPAQEPESEIVPEPANHDESLEQKQQREQAESEAEQARVIMEHAQKLIEQAQAAQLQTQQSVQAPVTQQPAAPEVDYSAIEQAKTMMQQAQMMMQQAQAAQLQVQQQAAQLQAQQAAQLQAQQQAAQLQAQQAAQLQAQQQAAQLQAQQAAQLQAQQQAAQLQAQQAAQLQAQQAVQLQAQAIQNAGAPISVDPYAVKEVDRLKNELDQMRDLVNKLTVQLAAPNNSNQNVQAPPQAYGYNRDSEEYRKLQSELEGMRREILEKDLRDREKELERKQREAENTVKDIRPEMVQMSDSRDVVPMNTGTSMPGSEYIPLANGVYYSTKDKQVYVMTLASGAANPTIERQAPPVKRVVSRTAPARRKPARRRPMSSMHRRPPRRPHR